jgi:hypothetical protein
MATAKQIAANRLNAQKSRGPVTEAGKKITSQNARRHGLCALFHVLPDAENQEDFDRLVDAFIEAEKPTDAVERELVVTMAEHLWLAKRATRMHNMCFVPQERTEDNIEDNEFPIMIEHASIQLYLRYHAAHYRAYRQAMGDLQERRKQRRLAAIGSVQHKHAEAEEVRREKRQVQRDERHAGAMRIQKEQEQIAHCRLIKISHDAAKLFQGLFPPEMANMAA